jgi:amidase
VKTFSKEDRTPVYSPFHEPIGTVTPGETFVVETEDGFDGRYQSSEDYTPENIEWVEDHLCIVTGPIAVEGASSGDVVGVEIEDVQVTTPAIYERTRYSDPSPEDWWLETYACTKFPVEDGHVVFDEQTRIPARPLIGCIATAPKYEVILARREGQYGGNMDCNDVSAGSTVILPVNVEGALLYFGDCKAGMSDGEIVNAAEVGTRISARASVRPRPKAMSWPRIETKDSLISIVSDISLATACRQSFREVMLWLEEDFAVDREKAAHVMGLVAHVRVCQVSNTFHTARCEMPREFIPKAR